MSKFSEYSTASGGGVGSVVQIQQRTYQNNSAHLSTGTSTRTSTDVYVDITPTKAGNTILIECYAMMTYQTNGSLCWLLHRSGDGVTDGYVVDTTSNYNTKYYYGWTYYNPSGWDSNSAFFADTTHNTTQELRYRLYHRNWSGSSTNYTSHQGMPVSMTAIEIETE